VTEGLRILKDRSPGLKQIVLITDGEIGDDPKGEQSLPKFEELGAELAKEHVKLSVYITGKSPILQRLDALKGAMMQIDFAQLAAKVAEGTVANRELFAERVKVAPREHELTEGLREFAVPWMNRVARRPDATLLAEAGPDPVAALWKIGSGTCVAFAYPEDVNGLIAKSIRWAASRRDLARFSSSVLDNELRLHVDLPAAPPAEIGAAEGTYQHPRTGTTSGLRLVRTGERTFEGVIDRPQSGSYHIDNPALRARGSVDVMCEPELMHLGLDSKSLSEAGTLVSGVEQIQAPPTAEGVVREDLRPWLAALAMVLLLAELILGAFWK
jgi:hypothetical protein